MSDEKFLLYKQEVRHTTSVDEVRKAWLLITNEPRITIRELAAAMGVNRTRAHHIIKFLKRTKYIKQKRGCTGHLVIIPFIELSA